MAILAAVLFALSLVPLLPMVFSTKGPGPEGAVGIHMITAPGALLQAAALAIEVHRGAWDFGPPLRAVWDVALPGYAVSMTLLPIFALPRSDYTGLARAGSLAVFAVAGAAITADIAGTQPVALRAATGILLALPCLAGWGLLAGLVLGGMARSARVEEEKAKRMNAFEREQGAYEVAEWAKMPPDAALWQLIRMTHSRSADVARECRARIAARPALEADMIALLSTGWATYAIPYLRDAWPLPMKPLAPAFAAFLEKELAEWGQKLKYDPNPGGWEANISGHFEVAAKIAAAGGDLAAPLAAWRALLENTRGMEGLAAFVKQIRPASL